MFPMMDDYAPTIFMIDPVLGERKKLHDLARTVGVRAELFSSALDFLDSYNPECPGCLVLEMRLPDMAGLELQSTLNTRRLHIPMIFVTAYADITSTSKAMKSGAWDVFSKPYDGDLLIGSIQQAISKDVMVRHDRAWREVVANRVAKLTEREREVLNYVVAGHPNKKSAADLGLSEKTIETYRSRILMKLELPTFIDVVRTVTAAQVCSVGKSCLSCRGIPYNCPTDPYQCCQLPGSCSLFDKAV